MVSLAGIRTQAGRESMRTLANLKSVELKRGRPVGLPLEKASLWVDYTCCQIADTTEPGLKSPALPASATDF